MENRSQLKETTSQIRCIFNNFLKPLSEKCELIIISLVKECWVPRRNGWNLHVFINFFFFFFYFVDGSKTAPPSIADCGARIPNDKLPALRCCAHATCTQRCINHNHRWPWAWGLGWYVRGNAYEWCLPRVSRVLHYIHRWIQFAHRRIIGKMGLKEGNRYAEEFESS